MKKALVLIPIIVALTACGTTDPYAKRAEAEREYETKNREKAVSALPPWMTKLPISNNAIFAAASGQAETISAAVNIARTNAMRDLCYSIDGKVDSQNKSFETANTKSSSHFAVTRTRCNAVDVTGIETYGAKGIDKNPVIVATGNTYTAYVLVALPTGDANVLRKEKAQERREIREAAQAEQAFKELDKND